MSERPVRSPAQAAEPPDRRDRSGPPADSAGIEAGAHDPTGLDLARSVAAGLDSSPVGGPDRPHPGRSRAARSGGPGGRGRRRDPELSGAHPDDRDPAPIATAIDKLVVESGWSTDVSVHTVLGKWPAIVGADVARHCTPVGYADEVVTVRADSTAWATQLRLLAASVVARLNAELGDGTVARIQVSGPETPSWRFGGRSVRGRGPRDTYG